MGVDLIGTGISMNNSGWHHLLSKLKGYGIDVESFRRSPSIDAATCHAIADALENNLPDLVENDFFNENLFDGLVEKRIPSAEEMQSAINRSISFWTDHIGRWRNSDGCDIM